MAKKPSSPGEKPAESPSRLASLDVFRGLTIVGMLLVNNLSLDRWTPEQLRHAPWNGGIHFADMVFPWFILITGVTIPFATASLKKKGVSPFRRVLKSLGRFAALFLVGCFLTSSLAKTPIFSLGVLQLLACAWLAASALYALPGPWRFPVIALLLVAHWGLIRFAPIPGQGAGIFTEETNVIGYLNQAYLQPLNLQGLVSVIPTTALALMGTLVGDLLRREEAGAFRKLALLGASGAGCLLAGLLWSLDLPFNKPVWTAPYILFSAGWGILVLGVTSLFTDVLRWGALFTPLAVFGTNAIAAYVVPIVAKVMILQDWQWTASDGTVLPLGQALMNRCYETFGRVPGGWVYTGSYILFWWIVMFILYRRKIFLRI